MADKQGCSDWQAWHDTQPVGTPTLHVTGKCHFLDSGYSVELKPHTPQGINPTILILDKIVHKPAHVSHHPETVTVNYTQKTSTKYVEVEILPDEVHIKVKEVS